MRSLLIPIVLLVSSVNASPFKRYDMFKRYDNSTESSVSSSILSSTGFTADVVSSSPVSLVEPTTSSAVADPPTTTTSTTAPDPPASSNIDTTVTVNEFITVTLPSTTITLSGSSASAELNSLRSGVVDALVLDPTITTTITQYATVTSNGVPTTVPTNTLTSTFADLTTSTITKFVTVTESDGSISVEPLTSSTVPYCIPTTETVTVTYTPTPEPSSGAVIFTSTFVSSYPVTAAFTYAGNITTITSYVDITSTQVITTTTSSAPSTSSVDPTSSYASYSFDYSAARAGNNGTVYSSVAASTVPSTSASAGPARRGLFYYF